MTLLDAYTDTLARHREFAMLHCVFWIVVGNKCGMSPSYARQRAAALGWPTTVAELGLLRRYAGKPKKPPPPKRNHDKTTLAMLRRALARLESQPATTARSRAMVDVRHAIIELGEP